MKPLVEFSKSLESHKYSNIMFNKPLIDKWDMRKKTNYKESKESSAFVSYRKSINKSHCKESCPFQPMHLQLLSKSTIFTTLDTIVLCGTW